MAYTTIKKPSDYFNTVTGNGSTNAQTGVGFQPDFTWIKSRSNAENHNLFDAVRGATKRIRSNGAEAEDTRTTSLTAFDSDGFTLGSGSQVNTSGWTFASWNWLGANGTSANTDGSISSTVSASTTSGFSIVSYTGTGSLATVGHGLGVAPAMIIMKNRSTTNGWEVYHQSLGNTKYMQLHTTSAEGTSATRWNNTSPTSTVFTVNTEGGVNSSGGNLIAYCFAEKTGYSKFGSYTGNGNADGTFVYTGFKPAWVLIKHASGGTAGGESWNLQDVKRSTYNPSIISLFPNTSDADNSTTNNSLDILSNGFKVRTVDNRLNNSGATYIYMAFAEEPLVGDNPATAR